MLGASDPAGLGLPKESSRKTSLSKQSAQDQMPRDVRVFLSVVGEVVQDHLARLHHQHSRIDTTLEDTEEGNEGSWILSSKRRRTGR